MKSQSDSMYYSLRLHGNRFAPRNGYPGAVECIPDEVSRYIRSVLTEYPAGGFTWVKSGDISEVECHCRESSGLVNLHRLNDILHLNPFLEHVNEHLPDGAWLVVCLETKNQRKQRLLNKFPPGVNWVYYTLDFVLKRVFPKWKPTRKLYFRITGGRNRVMTRTEAMGRLVSCGFSIVDVQRLPAGGVSVTGHGEWNGPEEIAAGDNESAGGSSIRISAKNGSAEPDAGHSGKGGGASTRSGAGGSGHVSVRDGSNQAEQIRNGSHEDDTVRDASAENRSTRNGAGGSGRVSIRDGSNQAEQTRNGSHEDDTVRDVSAENRSTRNGAGESEPAGNRSGKADRQNSLTYIIARKTGKPAYDRQPTYGALCRLKRVGLDGKPITVYKLRTMHPYSEYLQQYMVEKHDLKKGGKINNDFRITSWGRWFRRLWIDELPMLLNWFRRDMKLVGVRPLSNDYYRLYPEDVRELRNRVRPGLVPPFYADLPETLEEIVESERAYLLAYLEKPLRTDMRYFCKAAYNILIKRARSQ